MPHVQLVWFLQKTSVPLQLVENFSLPHLLLQANVVQGPPCLPGSPGRKESGNTGVGKAEPWGCGHGFISQGLGLHCKQVQLLAANAIQFTAEEGAQARSSSRRPRLRSQFLIYLW